MTNHKSEIAQKWHHLPVVHAMVCPVRRRWLRWRIHAPFWRDDKVAQMLGIAQYGCPRCGRGSIEERDSASGPPKRATLPPFHGGYRAGPPKPDTRPAPPPPPHTCHHYGRGEDCWDDDCDTCMNCFGSFPCAPRAISKAANENPSIPPERTEP